MQINKNPQHMTTQSQNNLVTQDLLTFWPPKSSWVMFSNSARLKATLEFSYTF